MAVSRVLDSAYARIVGERGERGERVAKDVSEDARGDIPFNFFLQLSTQFASKLGDSLSDTKLILTWLLTAAGAPAAAVAALVPVREAGSLIPQVVVGSALRSRAVRKWFWVVGALAQGGCIAAIALLVRFWSGPGVGWISVALIALFAVGRSICSVTSKDLVGKTIPKTRRGRLGGLASSTAGAITLGVGIWIALRGGRALSDGELTRLLWVAVGAWSLAAALMTALREPRGVVGSEESALAETFRSFRFLASDRDFRRFCVARALLASTVLSFPFYVILAQKATEGRMASLGVLLAATSSATALSGFAWGRLADRSSRLTLAIAGISAGLIGCVTFLVAGLGLGSESGLWVYGGLFFLVALAHTGIRLGRKTYVIDLATAETRSLYVAVSNTLIGGVLLLSGSFGALAPWVGDRGVILVFALLGLAGGTLAWFLREVEE